MLIFSVYDSKAGIYMQPLFFRTRPLAVRAFSAAALDAAHDFNKFASDFTLFELGSFDEEKGGFLNHQAPIMVVGAQTVLASKGE